ncbi:kinase-like domain-containing protein [Fomitopsis betulina]|nr:kinase-like domain-containing protein [Fomitopsis betulina]
MMCCGSWTHCTAWASTPFGGVPSTLPRKQLVGGRAPVPVLTCHRSPSLQVANSTPLCQLYHYDEKYPTTSAPLNYDYELAWIRRQPWLQSRGYMLRPRYRPGWIPSRRATGACPQDYKDSISWGVLPHVIDATRISDGKLVITKCVPTDGLELQIAMFVGTPPLSDDPTNHCVPVLDSFEDATNPSASYIVMPLLRYFDDPSFESIEDVLEFGEQLLEGLAFMHKNGVAHRDCASANIMMDGNPLFPEGFHPILQSASPSGQGVAWPLSRSHFHVQYYYIDFSISVYIPPDAHPKLAVGVFGRDQDPPELSDHIPYDPFKLDIFIFGNVLRKSFYDKFSFMRPIADMMTQPDPAKRPDATEALRQWRLTCENVPYVQRWWRLRRRDEPLGYSLSDYTYVITRAVHWLIGSKYTNNLLQD